MLWFPQVLRSSAPFSSKHRHWSPLISEVGLRAKKSLQHGASAVSKPHGAEFWHLPAPGWRREPIPGTGWARAGSGARGPPAKDQMAQVTLWEVLFFFTTLQKKTRCCYSTRSRISLVPTVQEHSKYFGEGKVVAVGYCIIMESRNHKINQVGKDQGHRVQPSASATAGSHL